MRQIPGWARTVLVVATALVVASAPLGSTEKTGAGNARILREPNATASPSKAGERLLDPTFGTTIVRVTDPSTAPDGATVNSAATDSMFNADGTRFYLHHKKAGTHLYAVDPATARVTRLGELPRKTPKGDKLAYDGAPWAPRVLYAIVMSPTRRELWQITLPLPGTLTLLHDFSQEVPTGGYPSSRVQVSPDGRYFAITASTTGGQDTYDHVVVWDRQSERSWVLRTRARLNKTLHAIYLDGSGEYLILTGGSTRHIWHWPSDTLEALTTGDPDDFKGHLSPGAGEVLNPGQAAGSWLRRSLAIPHTFTELLRYPRKGVDLSDWFEDSHTSRLLKDGSFVTTRFVASFRFGTFSRHAGAVYKLVGYLGLSPDFDPPEEVRYNAAPTGASVLFQSNWDGSPRTDTFLLVIPKSRLGAQGLEALPIGAPPLWRSLRSLSPQGPRGRAPLGIPLGWGPCPVPREGTKPGEAKSAPKG